MKNRIEISTFWQRQSSTTPSSRSRPLRCWRSSAAKPAHTWYLLLLLGLLQGSRLAAAADLTGLLQKARADHLADELTWQRILFYNQHKIGQPTGIVDDPHFYLSPRGKVDPSAELEATLTAFFQAPVRAHAHPLCRFPARRAWLEQRLDIPPSDWPQTPCPEFKKWWEQRDYAGLSMVFSSFFADSPPSLFGHIFLRLHRPRTSRHQSDLLDDIVSFAAQTDGNLSLTYGLKGAFGGFPGRFSLLPYYMKLQEYSNIESRDLWEYELKIDPPAIQRLLLSLWEFGQHHADYYYFDDNCAFVLLQLLETAKAEWAFTDQLKSWVTPSRGLKVVVQTEGIIKTQHYRPSALSRYRERFDQLNPAEQQVLASLLEEKQLNPDFAQLSAKQSDRRRIIDAALEFIEFKEKLGGRHKPMTYAALHGELLQARRQVPGGVASVGRIPANRNPQLGLGESWLMLSTGQIAEESRLRVTWQPLLQDLLADDAGYAEGMQIQLMPMTFDYVPERENVQLQRLDLISVASIQGSSRLLTPASWRLRLGWERDVPCIEQNSCGRAVLEGARGYGLALEPWSGLRFTSAVLLAAQAGALTSEHSQGMAQFGPELMLLAGWQHWLRLQLRAQLAHRWLREAGETTRELEAGAAVLFSPTFNLRLSFRFDEVERDTERKLQREAMVGGLYRF